MVGFGTAAHSTGVVRGTKRKLATLVCPGSSWDCSGAYKQRTHSLFFSCYSQNNKQGQPRAKATTTGLNTAPQSLAHRSNALFLHHVPLRDASTTAAPESAQEKAEGEKTPVFPRQTYPCREPHQRHSGRYVPRRSQKGKH